jgi:hypothetical protein
MREGLTPGESRVVIVKGDDGYTMRWTANRVTDQGERPFTKEFSISEEFAGDLRSAGARCEFSIDRT